MKKILFVLVLMVASVTAFAQSKTYKVKAGETIESVAHKHGVSVMSLLQANPEATENLYPGMKLVIPNGKYVVEEGNVVVNGDQPDSRQGRGSFSLETEFQYVMITGDAKDFYKGFNCGMSADVGYQYYIHNNLFVDGFVGYRWYTLNLVNDATENVHNITLPIHLGAHIDVSEKVGLRPFFGPRVDFPVSSRLKYRGDSVSSGRKTGVTLEFGIDFLYKDWGIRAKYGLGVGDYKNQNYVSIGVAAGI